MAKSGKPRKTWVYAPSKQSPPPVPPELKREVEEKVNALVEQVLKPRYVSPPPENPQFNYIEDLYTKWYRSFFYLCARYCAAGPHSLGGNFEVRFARLRYAGDGRFDLAFMRHTGQWVELYEGLALDECLQTIREDVWFHP